MEIISKKPVTYFELKTISIIALLFILRPSCPFFRYPFVALYISFCIYIIIRYGKQISVKSKGFFSSQILPLILLLILFICFIFSDKIYVIVLKDIVNALILYSFFFILYIIIDSKKSLSDFYDIFQIIFLFFSVFISLLGLVELFGLFPQHDLLSEYQIFSSHLRSLLLFDYNFAILPVLIGIIIVLNRMSAQRSMLQNALLIILFLIFFISVFLSGSFRGLVVLMIICGSMFFLKIISVYKNVFTSDKSNFKYNSILISIILIVIALLLFVFKTTGSFKTNTLEVIGSKNTSEVKFNISAYLYKYVSILDNKISPADFYKILWTPDFDPVDPDSGWGQRIHTDVYPLEGNNSEIIPKGSIGYKMDRRSDADTTDASYKRIWTAIHLKEERLNAKDSSYYASVYCYVSEDFDGSYARLYCYKALSYYDLNKKGSWQLLKIEFQSDKNASVEFEWAIPRNSDIRKINGYVVFAYPEYYRTHKPDSVSQTMSYNESSFIPAGIDWKTLQLIEFIPVKKWISGLFTQDTTFKAPENDLTSYAAKEDIRNNRIIRLKFGWQVFTREYTIKDKLVGHGFTFLSWYSYYLQKDRTQTEYPHNPFMHILLYSGIAGLCVYIYALYTIFQIFKRFRSDYSFFIFAFIITYFFTFFSGGAPFDPPVMGFFLIIPFFIQSIHNKILIQSHKV